MPNEIHQEFVNQALHQFQRDPRILGVAAGKPGANQKLDRFSAIDLVIVVRDAEFEQIILEGRELAQNLGHLLSAFPSDHLGTPNLWVCLFEQPLLHVDLELVTEEAFIHRTGNPAILWERNGELTRAMTELRPPPTTMDLQWIEDRFWTWVHYGALKIGRGEYFEAINFLAFMRASVIGPLLLQRCGQPGHGLRRIEEACPDELPALRSTLAATDAPESCEAALKATAKLYLELREHLADSSFKRHRRAEMAAMQFLHEAGEAARSRNLLQFRQA